MEPSLTSKYVEVIKRIYAYAPTGFAKPNLALMTSLSAAFNNPQHSYKCIHIAGTNGKGSVSVKCAAALQNAGYKTGLFVSPHITSFRERIQVNREKIDQETVVRLANRVLE